MNEYGRVANGGLVEARMLTEAPSVDWLPFKPSERPSFNPETQEVVEIAPLIESDGITRRWEVLTLAERRPGVIQMPNSASLPLTSTPPAARSTYRDEQEGIELDASSAAQSRFTSLVALIREALDFGALNNDSPQEIRDVNGVPHTLSVFRVRALMLRYGLHCKALFDEGDGKGGSPA